MCFGEPRPKSTRALQARRSGLPTTDRGSGQSALHSTPPLSPGQAVRAACPPGPEHRPKSASCLVPSICFLVPFQNKQTLFSRYDDELQKLSPANPSKGRASFSESSTGEDSGASSWKALATGRSSSPWSSKPLCPHLPLTRTRPPGQPLATGQPQTAPRTSSRPAVSRTRGQNPAPALRYCAPARHTRSWGAAPAARRPGQECESVRAEALDSLPSGWQPLTPSGTLHRKPTSLAGFTTTLKLLRSGPLSRWAQGRTLGLPLLARGPQGLQQAAPKGPGQ